MLPGLDKRQEQRPDWVAEGLADPQRRCVQGVVPGPCIDHLAAAAAM